MKNFFRFLFIGFITCSAHLAAEIDQTVYVLTMDESKIEIEATQPEGFLSEEIHNLDLVFQDPQDPGRRIVFHYFKNPSFDLTSLGEIDAYANWLSETLFHTHYRHHVTFQNRDDFAICSFITTENGKDVYCFLYIGKLGGEIVFGSIATSLANFETATQDNAHFLDNVTWKEKK